VAAACQGPDEYYRGPDAGLPPLGGQGGTVTGAGGSSPGTGGLPTGRGGDISGVAGTNGSAGTSSAAGTTGVAGTFGAAGTTGGTTARGGTTGAAGTTARGGTTGTAGTMGRGGTTGAAGTTARGGTTGTAGTMGRGGTTGAAGTMGRGGTTGTAGTTGSSMVLFSDDFESEATGVAMLTDWSRNGGSSTDWHIANDGTKVLQQDVKLSSTVSIFSATGAPGSPWSGAVSASARVKLIEVGSSSQMALLCIRYNDNSNRYCAALVPTGVQIQVMANGSSSNAINTAVTPAIGMFYDLRISVDSGNTLTVYLNGTQRGTFTPPSTIASGRVAVGTAGMMAAFDDVTVTSP
jgi:hypothetical protein